MGATRRRSSTSSLTPTSRIDSRERIWVGGELYNVWNRDHQASVKLASAPGAGSEGDLYSAAYRLPLYGPALMLGMIATRAHDDGHYELTGLPAGEYMVQAAPEEFRATHLMHTYFEPGPAGARRLTLALKAGEVRSRVDLALPRAFAIAGRVVDDDGEPAANVQITVGSRGAQQIGRTTDDRGMFRLFALTGVAVLLPDHSLCSRLRRGEG